uniref:C-type lectin domain-containing protein n=1 Tax=Acrobeloides nanus TaxID=290746 RepID=A0A914ELL9_9BILA
MKTVVIISCFGAGPDNDHKRNKRQTTCKAGYSYNAPTGYCYKYVSAAASFSNALTACRSDGGDLISILSSAENNMLDRCDRIACNNACINRGCQSGTCNIGCPSIADPTSPCNPAYERTCTCDFCTTTPCAQPGGADNGAWRTSCSSIGCASGDCFEGVTICVGCPATNSGPASWSPKTSAMGTCNPSVCNSYCQQHGCSSGGCDLYYSGVADNPCACDTCLNPSQYCTQAACNATCGAAGFGCHHGNCDQGICNCFICPNNVNTGK